MATFNTLSLTESYDIIDGDNGYSLTQGIQGADAMSTSWPDGAEAWPAGEQEFRGKPVEIAE